MIVTLTPAMTIVGIIHISMLTMKAMSEEKYLTTIHGQEYTDYCRKTGRFIPRLYRVERSSRDESFREAA